MKRLFRLIVLLLMMVSIPASMYLYIVPRFVGDQFVAAFIQMDVQQMELLLCDVDDFDAVRQVIAGAGGQLAGLIGGALSGAMPGNGFGDAVHYEATYYILTGDYVFQLVLDGSLDAGIQLVAGVRSPQITLRIHHADPGACVAVN